MKHAKQEFFKNRGLEFDAYIPSGENLKGSMYNLLGQKVAPIEFKNYGNMR